MSKGTKEGFTKQGTRKQSQEVIDFFYSFMDAAREKGKIKQWEEFSVGKENMWKHRVVVINDRNGLQLYQDELGEIEDVVLKYHFGLDIEGVKDLKSINIDNYL